MTPMERRGVDFSSWEADDEGFIVNVDKTMPPYSFEDKLLWEDSEKGTNIELSGMLPLDVQEWFDTHSTGLWFYEARFETNKANKMYYKKMIFTFHFEKLMDALVFKLAW
jgi:hypothetical protein